MLRTVKCGMDTATDFEKKNILYKICCNEKWFSHFHDVLSMNDKVYICMASKLSLVVPIRIKSGLVYNLIMMAFKEGLKVRYSSKYLSVSMSLRMKFKFKVLN